MTIDTYLETGKSRTFAGALDWPGWCRSGRDAESALAALVEYGPRYARVLSHARLGFRAPADARALKIVERLEGNATTDFGAPDAAPRADDAVVTDADLKRLVAVLRACWRALDSAGAAAANRPLRKGPRGGGRDLDKIFEHVVESEGGYLQLLDWKVGPGSDNSLGERMERTRAAILAALDARRKKPAPGPRGGARWSPRYFVRRVAWHSVDHAWEIEDRREK